MQNTEFLRRADALRARLLQQHEQAAVVRVTYDGYADNGTIESIDVLTEDGTPIQIASDAEGDVEEEIIELFYDLLDARWSGWQDNDGACGTFEWDLRTNALDHEHNVRFEDYHTHTLSAWDDLEGEGAQACSQEQAAPKEGC